MNIGIFENKENETIVLFKEALKKRGHNVTSIKDLYFEISDSEKNKINVDAIYYWFGLGTLGRKCILEYFNKKGVKIANSAFFKDPFFNNKIYQNHKVSNNNILSPKTIIQSKAEYEKISSLLGDKFIMKASIGSCGRKVYLVDNKDDFKKAQEELKGSEILYQEFIPNSGDYRVHVIGGKAICAYKRVPLGDDFRANISVGGSAEKIEDEKILSKIFEISEKVSSSFDGADIVGIDLIQDNKTGEIYFIELNAIPGIRKVHEITGVNMAEKMVDYFEDLVKN